MKKVYTYSIVFLFFLILLLPTLLHFTGYTSLKTMESSQETLVTGSGLSYLKALAKRINSYYVGNFSGRSNLVHIHSLLNYYGFKQSPIPEQVVFGKDGWLFAGDQNGRVMKQHMGLYPLSVDSARYIAEHLLVVQQKLAQRKINFYVLIAPDSPSIYPEKLPDFLESRSGKLINKRPETPHDVLSTIMKQYPQIAYVDLRDTLLQAKRLGPVYQQTDTHWNNRGALIGSTALIGRMRLDFPKLRTFQQGDYRFAKTASEGGDLAGLMMMRDRIREPYQYWIELKKPLKVVEEKATGTSIMGYPDRKWSRPEASQPRLLVFGDSFSPSMMLFLTAHFRESYLVRQSTIDWKRIEAEKPDAVVVEIVERNLRALSRL